MKNGKNKQLPVDENLPSDRQLGGEVGIGVADQKVI